MGRGGRGSAKGVHGQGQGWCECKRCSIRTRGQGGREHNPNLSPPSPSFHSLVLDHVCDLVLHREPEERDEVEQEDGPEDGNVEDGRKGHEKGDYHGAGGAVPEGELANFPLKRPELLRVCLRETITRVRVTLRARERRVEGERRVGRGGQGSEVWVSASSDGR